MKNPFQYAEIVTRSDFADREEEIKELVLDLESGQNIFLYSPRRYGKTSLIINVLEELKAKEMMTVYIDCYRISSKKRLLEAYVKAVTTASSGKIKGLMQVIKGYMPRIAPKIVLKGDQAPEIEVSYDLKERELEEFLDQAYDIPQRIAKKKGQNFVVVFDEFQEILRLNGLQLEKEMRSKFQHHQNVAYVFMGSKRHLLEDMFLDVNRPFYKMGKMISLSKIPEHKFAPFLESKFTSTGFVLEGDVIGKVLKMTNNLPYYAQLFCHNLWNYFLDTKKISSQDVDWALEKSIRGQSDAFITIWDGLSLHQRAVVGSLSKSKGKAVFSKNFIKENDLTSPASIQTSLNLLSKKYLVEKENNSYYITDPFFAQWIKMEMV